jgi:hypothetical protein
MATEMDMDNELALFKESIDQIQPSLPEPATPEIIPKNTVENEDEDERMDQAMQAESNALEKRKEDLLTRAKLVKERVAKKTTKKQGLAELMAQVESDSDEETKF